MTERGDNAAGCANCGRPLPSGARFCRGCGAPAQAPTPALATPPTPPPARRRSGRGRTVLLALLIGLLAGIGAGAAVLLLGQGEDEKRSETGPSQAATVPATQAPATESGEADSAAGGEAGAAMAEASGATVGLVVAGSYVQAGSFRSPENAEGERDRLVAEGVEVEVIESDQAQELYPGFQVLVAGPFETAAAARPTLRLLRDSGVPSAFLRPLSPAREIAGPEAIAGNWSGELERSGSDRPSLNGKLRTLLRAAPDGRSAELEFPELGCSIDLSLAAATAVALAYRQASGCVGVGEWRLRPEGGSVALTLLPPENDTIVLGNLRGT